MNTITAQEKEELLKARLAETYIPGAWFSAERVTGLGLTVFLIGILLSTVELYTWPASTLGIGIFSAGVIACCVGLGVAAWSSTPAYADAKK
jgi:hypothetical protein